MKRDKRADEDLTGPSEGQITAAALGLRTVAVFEAAKGVLVLVAGTGLLLLVHRDVQQIGERLVAHLHLNPASHYPRIFLKVASEATPQSLRLLALGALFYSVLRMVEAVGLWHERRWAEWLGLGSGLAYLPFEVVEWVRRPGMEPVIAVGINLVVVAFLFGRLHRRREEEA